MNFFSSSKPTEKSAETIDEQFSGPQEKLKQLEAKSKKLDTNPIHLGNTLKQIESMLDVLQTEIESQIQLKADFEKVLSIVVGNQEIMEILLKQLEGLDTSKMNELLPLLKRAEAAALKQSSVTDEESINTSVAELAPSVDGSEASVEESDTSEAEADLAPSVDGSETTVGLGDGSAGLTPSVTGDVIETDEQRAEREHLAKKKKIFTDLDLVDGGRRRRRSLKKRRKQN
jgi:hypothetical protein